MADWDALVVAEPVDIDGRHPSYRDLRDELDTRLGRRRDEASTSDDSMRFATLLDAHVAGDVVGWWGDDVVIASDVHVTLFDVETKSATHVVPLTVTAEPRWDHYGAAFATPNRAYVLTSKANEVTATMIVPGGPCSIVGRLMAVERGFDAEIFGSDGSIVMTGRAPVAISPAADAVATMTEDGTLRVTRLDADLNPIGSVDADVACATLSWFPDGSRLVGGGEASQTVFTISAADGTVTDQAVMHVDDPITDVAAAPSGDLVASVGHDGVVGVRRLDPALSVSHSTGERLEQVCWDSAGALIAVRGSDGWLVESRDGERIEVGQATTLAWHPSDRMVATSDGAHLRVQRS